MNQESYRDRQRRMDCARQEIQSLSEEIHRMNQALLLDKQHRAPAGSASRSEAGSPELLRVLKKLRGTKGEG